MNKRKWKWTGSLLVLITLLLPSCSLLKVNTDFGGKPLNPKALNARVAVRAYATNFTDLVAQAADSVRVMSGKDPALSSRQADSVKLAAIRWKRNASAAAMNASLSSIPEGAVLNTWILLRGMAGMNWEQYLGKYGFVGERTSEELLNQYRKLAASFIQGAKFNRMATFVDSIAQAVPLNLDFQVEDYSYPWFAYSGVPDSLAVSTVGSISEVIADLNDRVGKYSSNVTNQLEWGKQQLEVHVDAFLADSVYRKGLDSLNRSLTLLKSALRDAPQKADSLISDVNMRLMQLVGGLHRAVEASMDSAFVHLAAEREELTAYLSAERAAMMQDGKVLLDDSAAKLVDRVEMLIKNLLIYFVLFVLLLVGVPFYVGYRMGRRGNKN